MPQRRSPCRRAAGLDTTGWSVPYVASWGGKDPLAAMRSTAELVDRLAKRIEVAIAAAANEEKGAQPAGATAGSC